MKHLFLLIIVHIFCAKKWLSSTSTNREKILNFELQDIQIMFVTSFSKSDKFFKVDVLYVRAKFFVYYLCLKWIRVNVAMKKVT